VRHAYFGYVVLLYVVGSMCLLAAVWGLLRPAGRIASAGCIAPGVGSIFAATYIATKTRKR
jgi:hypothetical protein